MDEDRLEDDQSEKPQERDNAQLNLEQSSSQVQNAIEVTDKSHGLLSIPRKSSVIDTLEPQRKFDSQATTSQEPRVEAIGKEDEKPSLEHLENLGALGTLYSNDIEQEPAPPSANRKMFAIEPTKETSTSSPQEQRRESVPNRILSKVLDTFSRRSSSKTANTGFAEDVSVANSADRRRSSMKPPIKDRRKSSARTVNLSFVGIDEPRRRSSAYNPFGSFERHVSIANPEADTDRKISIVSETPRATDTNEKLSIVPPSPRVSISERPPGSAAILEKRRRSSFPRPGRQRSVSVVDLTKQDIAICFFPEEPDWGDDDDEDDDEADDYFEPFFPRREHSDSLFPDPKTPYDWTQRERWHSRLVYLIALVTYSMSFSNIYHFPALLYHYGGIPFLIPYTIFTLILGYPLHFLESSLGQYSQSGPVRVWDAAPIARGVGWSMFFLCLIVAYYYNMYAAYSIIYFSRCFNTILPWQDCDEPATSNYSCVPRMCARPNANYYTPAQHYFFHHVLEIQPSTEILGHGLGPMIWTQVIGFLFAWSIVYVAIIQSVRSIGKVVFALVILPYFILLMLLSAGLMLQGSSRGIQLFFSGNFNQLLDIQLWRVAAEEVFFELGICQGTPLAYGSYCHHRNPTHADSAIICLVNYCTSILCAFVIFLILGALSLEIGAPVADVLHHGPGLVFIAYPEALSRVPGSHFWCFMFFLMLFSVAIGTQIAIMETVMTIIYDEFNSARPYRWLINLLICCCLFLLGLVLCTSNGYFVVHLLDRMTGTMPRLPIAVCMVGTIVLIYGASKYCEDIHFMIGYYPNMFIRFCFLITPFMLLALTIPSWVFKKPLQALNLNYSQDAINVAWFTIWFILIWIVLGAIYWGVYCYSIGELKGILRSLNSWGPRNFDARVARTEFSSEDVSNFTKPWTKKSVRIEEGDVG